MRYLALFFVLLFGAGELWAADDATATVPVSLYVYRDLNIHLLDSSIDFGKLSTQSIADNGLSSGNKSFQIQFDTNATFSNISLAVSVSNLSDGAEPPHTITLTSSFDQSACTEDTSGAGGGSYNAYNCTYSIAAAAGQTANASTNYSATVTITANYI